MSRAKTTTALLLLATLSGCRNPAPPPDTVKKPPPRKASTISEKIQHKISVKVIGQTPDAGRLAQIKKRGILRVALPPRHLPFQSMNTALHRPVGFNVALAGAIAEVLEVKPNFTILSPSEIKRINRQQPEDEYYDLVFRTPSMTICRSERSLPYFFLGRDDGWLTICVAGSDKTLSNAIENSLTYFAESGIFTSLYTDYFE